MRDVAERLRDILDAITQIGRYASRGREAFEREELIQVWVVHHLQIIGEAASRLGREFHAAHPEVPWPKIVAMRNVLVHDYFGVDLNELWNLVQRDLGPIQGRVELLLAELERKNQ
ncbi:conserved hypothetical protein [Acidobacteriia bacterium SbA2]|nr:conserved hypothetical protein [Acidobacteriia bacterium SbA2]